MLAQTQVQGSRGGPLSNLLAIPLLVPGTLHREISRICEFSGESLLLSHPLSSLSHILPQMLCSAFGLKNGLDYKCVLRQAQPPRRTPAAAFAASWQLSELCWGHSESAAALVS